MSEREPCIMIVDDEAAIRQIFELSLVSLGHKIVCAENGVVAGNLLEKYKPLLIILDMNMPKMGGVSFYYDHVASRIDGTPRYPTLVVSGRDELEGTFKEFQVDGFISKPFEMDFFQEEVKKILLQKHPDLFEEKQGNGEIILIVEDDREGFAAIEKKMKKNNYDARQIGDPNELHQYLDSLAPEVVFVKVASQSLSGPELFAVAKLKTQLKEKKIPLFLFSYRDIEITEDNLEAMLKSIGATGLITKTTPDDLCARIAAIKSSSNES